MSKKENQPKQGGQDKNKPYDLPLNIERRGSFDVRALIPRRFRKAP